MVYRRLNHNKIAIQRSDNMYIHDKTEQAYKNGYEAGIKEFAERLKEIKANLETLRMPLLNMDIDNLVKEMELGK